MKKKKHSSAKIVQPKQRHRKGRNALMSACDDGYRGINLDLISSCPRKLRKFGKLTFFTGLAFFFLEKIHVQRLANEIPQNITPTAIVELNPHYSQAI